jgi:DNA sulfur modification protein DndC
LDPYTIEARQYGVEQVLSIQEEINRLAAIQGRPKISLISEEELQRIYWHWQNNIYPDKWDGSEPIGNELFDRVFSDGSVQPLLPFWD